MKTTTEILGALTGEWQTGREVAAKLGVVAGQSRPVIETIHALAAEGKFVEQEPHDGLLGSGPKRYRLRLPQLADGTCANCGEAQSEHTDTEIRGCMGMLQ
jgi:hypothetical protein